MALRVTALFVLLAAFFLLASGGVQGVNVTFEIDYKVEFGQGFVIAGNVEALGNWNATALMNISGDRFWWLTVDLEADSTVEYKVVRVVYDTLDILQWYPSGDNLVLDVPSTGPYYEYIVISELSTSVEQLVAKY
eukprot:c20106_g1_i1 orf=222-626(+)